MENVYYDMTTKNKSFIDLHNHLKSIGVKNNSFHLKLINKDLQGIDPYDQDLTSDQKRMIIQECKSNLFYYLREVVRITQYDGSLISFRINEDILTAIYCFYNNMNFYIMSDPQTGKTTAINAMLSHAYKFHATPKEFVFQHTKLDCAKRNRAEMKNIIANLPIYMNDICSEKNNECERESIIGHVNNKDNAENIGRTLSGLYQFFDDVDFAEYINDIISVSCTPHLIRSTNADRDNKGYCRMFATSHNLMDNNICQSALKIVDDSLPWYDKYYDMSVSELKDMLCDKSIYRIVYINH